MWVRQCDVDDDRSPVPTRIASNEEFIPPPPTPQQLAVAERVRDLSAASARALGLDRRVFLRTGAGMAAGLLALNEVFGPYYEVSAAETKDPEAFAEKWPKDQFIFDIQTHHVDVSKKWYDDTE